MFRKLFLKLKRRIESLIWQLRGYPAFDVETDDDVYDDTEYCQDCGCMLDWDMEGSGDDIVRPGYVTASGDVFCRRCGRAYDEEEERLAEEDADWYPDPMFDGSPDPVEQAEQDADDEEDECTWEDEA